MPLRESGTPVKFRPMCFMSSCVLINFVSVQKYFKKEHDFLLIDLKRTDDSEKIGIDPTRDIWGLSLTPILKKKYYLEFL